MQVTKASHEKERLAHNLATVKQKLESLDESEHKRQKLERENQNLVAELEKLSLIQVLKWESDVGTLAALTFRR